VPNRLDVSWMKIECKSHLNATDISTWCKAMSFGTKVLYDLFNAIREICYHNCHLKLKNNLKNQSLIYKFFYNIY
jgi:hypothetical protein